MKHYTCFSREVRCECSHVLKPPIHPFFPTLNRDSHPGRVSVCLEHSPHIILIPAHTRTASFSIFRCDMCSSLERCTLKQNKSIGVTSNGLYVCYHYAINVLLLRPCPLLEDMNKDSITFCWLHASTSMCDGSIHLTQILVIRVQLDSFALQRVTLM